MTLPAPYASTAVKHPGPPLWLLAGLYALLFNIGLAPVTMLGGLPYWPGPWEPASVIVPYFQTHASRVLFCVFFQFGATICLGLFTATIVSRLQFLGLRAAGVQIALLGGFLMVFNGVVASFGILVVIHPLVGLVLAAAGELSAFYFLNPRLLFLIPLTRFPGFIWIVAVGIAMPHSRPAETRALAA